MSFRINTPNSLYGNFQLQNGQKSLQQSLERIASGHRINRASDDAAGMVIADKLASQRLGFGQAIRNANDTISIVQTADGALGQATQILQDIRVKALQAASGAQSQESRQAIQADIGKALSSLSDIAQNTSYNGQKLLSGAFSDKTFQIGANSGETVDLSIGSIDPGQITHETLGSLSEIDVTTDEGAQAAIQLADTALAYVNEQRSGLGSTQNQLSSTINNLYTAKNNTAAAESVIRDTDYAEESIILNRISNLQKARAFARAKADETAKKIVDILG
ncbi:MAG: flagellin FliC [Desulfobacteraceae bacterium]|nr:MAG: flagellin FliC [Desulfobacteraceae bacterium]